MIYSTELPDRLPPSRRLAIRLAKLPWLIQGFLMLALCVPVLAVAGLSWGKLGKRINNFLTDEVDFL